MLPFSLSGTDADMVNIERKTHKSALVRDRMRVLGLLYLGFSRQDCALIVGCHVNSVTNYIKLYNEGGLDRIRQLNYSYSRHELQEAYGEVEQVLSQANCSTIAEAGQVLAQHFDYRAGKEAVRQLLHRLGFKRRKAGTFPGKVDQFEQWQNRQEAFLQKLWQLIDQAEKEEIDLVFTDAAHFVYGQFSQYCWSKSPCYAPSGHGRYRVNVYGAYDVITNGVYTMYNEGYIDAEFVVEYLYWLRDQVYTDQNRPLHLILDNARYQHCKYVKQEAEKLNIILEFLPGYSPNLNLIERLWKYLKRIIGRTYHDNKTDFQNAIIHLLESLGEQDHQNKLRTLLNPRFQQFSKSQILSG